MDKDIAITVDSIIANGIEETGASSVEELTEEQAKALLHRVWEYVSTV